jgi:YHS domain-containing protein
MIDKNHGQAIDPVCGMMVDPEAAAAVGLSVPHDERTFYFCGKGCLLEFRDDPEKYLDPDYTPSI